MSVIASAGLAAAAHGEAVHCTAYDTQQPEPGSSNSGPYSFDLSFEPDRQLATYRFAEEPPVSARATISRQIVRAEFVSGSGQGEVRSCPSTGWTAISTNRCGSSTTPASPTATASASRSPFNDLCGPVSFRCDIFCSRAVRPAAAPAGCWCKLQ